MKTKKKLSQLKETLASERNARTTVPQARAIMHDIKSSRGGYHPQGASKKGPGAGKDKGKAQSNKRNNHGRAPGQSSNVSMSQAGTRPQKPMTPSTRPCPKCGSRDHESDNCPKNQNHRSYMAHAMCFMTWCLGSDEMNGDSVADEVGAWQRIA